MERTDPALAGTERELLTQFLDYQRATVLRKVTGLAAGGLTSRPVSTSALTLAGLVKHMALVEDSWFQEVFLGREMPEPWAGAPFDADRDWEFHSAAQDRPADLAALYEAACERSRRAVAGAETLDQLSAGLDRRTGRPFSLRWILLHMVEETARHNGHADLLREAVDGETGE